MQAYTNIGDGFSLARNLDPFRDPGYLSPGYDPANLTDVSVIDAILKNAVMNGDTGYAPSANAKLHSFDVIANEITNDGTFPHTVSAHSGHSSVVCEDVVLYKLNGTPYLFYSWNDNTDGDIGRYDLSSTFDDDYVSTIATSGAVLQTTYPHPMIVGDDNILYIADGSDLASLQGTTSVGIFNPSALDLPEDYVITSFSKTPNFLVLIAHRVSGSGTSYNKTDAKAFFWDYVSASFTYAVPLPGNYANAGFILDGNPGCFVQGGDYTPQKDSKIVLLSTTGYEVLEEFDEDIPAHGGVDVVNRGLIFNVDGDLFTYMSLTKGGERVLSNISSGDGSTSGGFVKVLYNPLIFASSGTGTSGGLQTFSTNFVDNVLAISVQKQLPTDSDFIYRIAKVRVSFRQKMTGTGRGLDIKVVSDGDYDDDTSTTRGTTTTIHSTTNGEGATIDKLVKVYTEDTSGNELPKCSTAVGLRIGIDSGDGVATIAPQIESVDMYLEPLSVSQTT